MSFLGYIRTMSSHLSEKFMQFRRSSIDRLIVRSALNPILWPTGLIGITTFYLSSLTQGNLSIGFFSIGALLVLTTIFSYLFMLFKRPEDLRSEEFLLKREELRLIGSKDNPEGGQIAIGIKAIEGNSSLDQLTGKDSKNG